jgi:tRNA (guanine-N7-)-methyltransferase
MSEKYGPPEEYRTWYLHRVCKQNEKSFNSDYVWTFQPTDLPLDPRIRFPECAETFLEIGFGHGEVLEELVRSHPETGFLGIERRPYRVRKAIKRLERIGAVNAALLRVNLELLNDELFPPGCFDRILVNHPDPWPKKKHKHHRFFRPDTLNWLVSIIASGGYIEVASDHTEYFFNILRLFEEHPRLESALPPPFYNDNPGHERPMSRFEKKKRAAGETVRFLRFTKKD